VDGQWERALVIRVWAEPGREPTFRARLIAVGPSDGGYDLGVVTSEDAVIERLRNWLRGSCEDAP
jgi:hypothetical protein